ncbi:MAG: hypothetical protein GTO45_14435 [Candidatus Aminicenantes bacterium]|nr:hypothetical protein [Candidatus Aminicenantes bacterium]NIM79964.1 hypothetical protein [Candidatus Aminicenantes bacterium]NIN19303.1 hypothetical protein [Candidatus Aminicenantes bacterium]NIN43206.1 hypothetical protein [Candidatus Aminicenantes bacterium]NIN85945.1 hypothetical protein [Candidatus Aminicenantes bacterium]
MARHTGKQTKKSEEPGAEDFSKKAIEKAVFLEAIQHPTTLYPAALSLLSAAYMVLVSLDPTSLAVAVGSGFLSLVSWIYHYFIRGEAIAESHVQKLKAKRDLHKERQAGNIEEECKTAGFLEGEKEARELKQAYNQLYTFLKEKLEKHRVMTAGRFLILAEETYFQGLQLLKKALTMFNALKQIDNEKLEEEKKTFKKELKAQENKDDESRQPIIEALQTKIRSHEKRLKLYEERNKGLEQLMAQCEVLEATLDTTYLEVVDLIDNEAFMKRSSVAHNLERAVAAARRVEERLRKRESKTFDADDAYIYEKDN